MPSPKAGEGNDTEGFKVVSSNEFDDAIFDLDFTFAAEMARKFSQDTSPSTHSQQHPQHPVSGEVHESSRTMTVPLKSDDTPSAIIKRPRSSGEPPSQGFKFVKATGRQLDMTRKRSSKTQASEIPEPRAEKKQGHAGKLPPVLEVDHDSHLHYPWFDSETILTFTEQYHRFSVMQGRTRMHKSLWSAKKEAENSPMPLSSRSPSTVFRAFKRSTCTSILFDLVSHPLFTHCFLRTAII